MSYSRERVGRLCRRPVLVSSRLAQGKAAGLQAEISNTSARERPYLLKIQLGVQNASQAHHGRIALVAFNHHNATGAAVCRLARIESLPVCERFRRSNILETSANSPLKPREISTR